jgi:hypothetical protein
MPDANASFDSLLADAADVSEGVAVTAAGAVGYGSYRWVDANESSQTTATESGIEKVPGFCY